MSDPSKAKAAHAPPLSGSSLSAGEQWSPKLAAHELSGVSRHSGGLKVVTLAPGIGSIPDPETSFAGRYDPYIGCTVDDRYKVEEVLGEGGMGVVYRCTHKIIGKKVAMKVLRSDLARDAEVMERFLNEAKAASAIGNPHIIDISDFGQLPDGSTYFIMEFLEGVSLTSVMQGVPVAVARIVHIARQLSEALAAAHQAGIVHRDLKPDNIFLVKRGAEKDFVKILDFGIAKVSTSGDGKLTRAGAVFGTPHYMSPEQAAGAPIDHRGDIYSFGVILYEMASGKVPFDADNFMGILTQHMYKSPVPIRAIVPQPQEVPPGLEAIVLKCLSKRAEQRYQSMDEVIADLDKLRDGTVPDAVSEMMARSGGFNVPTDYFKQSKMPAPVPATPAGLRRRSRWPLFAGIAGVLAAVIIVVAIFAKSSYSTASPDPSLAAKPQPSPQGQPQVAPLPADQAERSTRQVLLAVEPMDAQVFKGDQALGTSPLLLEIDEGTTVKLRIERKGYKTQEIELDGSQPKQSVKLEPAKTAAPAAHPVAVAPKTRAKAAPASGKGKSKANIGGGEIVNPWE